MTAITCGDRMFTRPPLLTEPSDCRDFARYLDGFGNDDRVDAEYITGAVSASTPCEVCQEHGCVGQVHVSWLPRGCARWSSVDAGVGCVEEYLAGVVQVEAGDPDVHRDLVDVEVRCVG
jgi:hypothetical protein